MLFFLLQHEDRQCWKLMQPCLPHLHPVAHSQLGQSRYPQRLQKDLTILLNYTDVLTQFTSGGTVLSMWLIMQGFQTKQYALLEPDLTSERVGSAVTLQDEFYSEVFSSYKEHLLFHPFSSYYLYISRKFQN